MGLRGIIMVMTDRMMGGQLAVYVAVLSLPSSSS